MTCLLKLLIIYIHILTPGHYVIDALNLLGCVIMPVPTKKMYFMLISFTSDIRKVTFLMHCHVPVLDKSVSAKCIWKSILKKAPQEKNLQLDYDSHFWNWISAQGGWAYHRCKEFVISSSNFRAVDCISGLIGTRLSSHKLLIGH